MELNDLMKKGIVIAAATEIEAAPFRKLNIPGVAVSLLITGIGGVAAVWGTMDYFARNGKPDLLINTGIAGSFSEKWPIGNVVVVGNDSFADLGIDDNGRLMTLFEAGIDNPDSFPFEGGRIYADRSLVEIAEELMPVVKGVTVNRVTGTEEGASSLRLRMNADIESMEGAAIYYVCRRESVPVIGVRAISNMVGKRDKEKWDIEAALAAVKDGVDKFIVKVNGR